MNHYYPYGFNHQNTPVPPPSLDSDPAKHNHSNVLFHIRVDQMLDDPDVVACPAMASGAVNQHIPAGAFYEPIYAGAYYEPMNAALDDEPMNGGLDAAAEPVAADAAVEPADALAAQPRVVAGHPGRNFTLEDDLFILETLRSFPDVVFDFRVDQMLDDPDVVACPAMATGAAREHMPPDALYEHLLLAAFYRPIDARLVAAAKFTPEDTTFILETSVSFRRETNIVPKSGMLFERVAERLNLVDSEGDRRRLRRKVNNLRHKYYITR